MAASHRTAHYTLGSVLSRLERPRLPSPAPPHSLAPSGPLASLLGALTACHAATASCNSPPRHAQSQCTSRPGGCASPTAGQSYRRPVLPPASPTAGPPLRRLAGRRPSPPPSVPSSRAATVLPLSLPGMSLHASRHASSVPPQLRHGQPHISGRAQGDGRGGAFDETLLLHASPPPQFRPR